MKTGKCTYLVMLFDEGRGMSIYTSNSKKAGKLFAKTIATFARSSLTKYINGVESYEIINY